ncbi:focadhesin [Microplitis demolitor]|uniref:focadhesin n=1 Tax=Microplitis demolitor TaxID=69319 RepID=UPI00235B5E80|nr:focadhesin [Microplitis demolitor]
MDEIEYKLSSNNSILITHGISKILEITKNKISNNEDPLKISELKSLFTKCKSENAVVSLVSCHAVVALVESGLIEISPTLSKLIAILGETKNYSAVTSAICSLLALDLKSRHPAAKYECPFSIQAPQHPLITVLNEKTDSWRNVLGEMKSMLHDCKPESVYHHVELLRPVFMYILGNPTFNSSAENFRQQTWHLLMKTSSTLELQLEIIQWLRTNNLNSCINTNNLVLELTEFAVTKNNKKLFTALGPLIAALALDLLKHNYDPRSNIVMIESILEHADPDNPHDNLIANITVSILSEMLIITPVIYLHDLIKIAASIINKLQCNEIVAHSLVSSILPWMAYATPLSSDALEIADNLINTITATSDRPLKGDSYPEKIYNDNLFSHLHHANRHLQFYTNLCVQIESCVNLNICLDTLSNIPKEFLYRYKLIIGGIFLESKSTETILKAGRLLVRIARENNNFAGHVLSMLLYKLSNSRKIEETKELLFILPELAVSKENVPIIVQTLQTLVAADEPLKYVAINLFLKAWMVEPRCHRYLLTALIDMNRNDKSTKANVTCAKAMVFICENKPEHGAELVPLLSQTLNRCGDTVGSAASALALRGISALCVAGIADVCSTWRVLSPKMNKEERSIVIKSMCDFFADIPSNVAHPEEQFEELVDQSLKKLWELTCFETTRNLEIVEAAFKALAAYTINQIKITVLPEVFMKDLVSYKRAQEGENKEEEVEEKEDKAEQALTYIPSTCWITMLETIYEPALSLAGDLIIKFITDELYGFKTGIYMWAMGEPINFKYLPEKSPVRAVGEYLRRYSPDNLNPQTKKILMECLRIFSYKYPKPLPPIKWELFSKAINVSPESFTLGISLACHQAAVSPSAKEFVSKYLTEMTAKFANNSDITITSEEFKQCWHLCTHLDDICRGVTSGVLGPFLDVTFNCIIDKAAVGDETAVKMFDELMGFYSKALTDDLVHFDNKTLITEILEKLFDKIDVDSKIFEAYTRALLGMTAEKIERITLPSVWDAISNDKLKKAIKIRAGLVLKRDNEIPLSWMNEIIRVSSSEPGVHKCLLSNMKIILSKLLTEKSNASWSWDLMCRIQATIVNSHDNYSLETTSSLCDILFLTIIVLACDNCFVENDETLITSHDMRIQLFPHAMATIVSMPYWKEITQQTMEWLNFMRTSTLPTSYKIVFHNTLVSLKGQRHLNDLWTKYLSIKSPIQLSK